MNKKLQFLKKDVADHFFKDKKGKVVLMQSPNPPLIAFITSQLFQVVSSGNLQQVASIIAFGSLFTWAWLELFQGTNYFRRLLGFTVLVFAVINRIS
jgi:hypothetical protein